MRTKSILLFVLIASAMIQVFGYLCICVFVSLLILAMFQDQGLVASKHLLVETKDKNLADTPVVKNRKTDAKFPESGQTEHGTDYWPDLKNPWIVPIDKWCSVIIGPAFC